MPELARGRGQERCAAPQHVQGACVGERVDPLVWNADGQLVVRVPAEVADRQHLSEAVAVLGRTRDSRHVLVPALAARRRQPRAAAGEQLHHAGVDDGAEILAVGPDRQVIRARAADIAYGERAAELVPGLPWS